MGLSAAIDYLNAIGMENISQWEHELLLYATEKLEQIPALRIIGTAAHKSAIISFVVEGAHYADIGMLMDLKGIALRTGRHCAQPTMAFFGVPGTVRLSFAFYNTKAEIDWFVSALKAALPALIL
jgi:cysteine desulfurase/selenocysteine lyase